MISSVTPIGDEHNSISWPIQSFAIDDFKSPSPAHLLLDRANAEFGLVYQTGPRIAVMAQFPDTGESIFFQASKTRAACTRFNTTCKKVCVLMQHMQIDLNFTSSASAGDFVHKLGRMTTKIGNLHFEIYEASSNAAFARPDFSMEKEGHTDEKCRSWMAVHNEDMPEWARIYKTGKCADFTIVAGGREFPVHRVLLSTRSQYFNAVCDGNFTETQQRTIKLPESAETVSTMLQEMYEVYNPTTGSIFTNFALRCALEKDCIMSALLALFVACDKYNLESIKQKASEAVIDRLPFVHDPLSIVDLASSVYSDIFPGSDYGLRHAVVLQLHARLPAIMEDKEAWQEYSENKVILKALHAHQCEMQDSERSFGMFTPPTTPTKK